MAKACAPYVVRWDDSGHRCLFFPGPDASVQYFAHRGPGPSPGERPGNDRRKGVDHAGDRGDPSLRRGDRSARTIRDVARSHGTERGGRAAIIEDTGWSAS